MRKSTSSRRRRRPGPHPTLSAQKGPIKPRKLYPNRGIIAGVLLALMGAADLFVNGASLWFWFFFVFGALIVLPNALYLRFKKGAPFGIPYVITMLKTKRFIVTMQKISHRAWILEKISFVGLLSGFGLVAVDYFWARKRGGWKRLAMLAVAAAVLAAFFMAFLGFMFSIPLFAQLLIPCLVGFVILGFGGMMFAMLLGYGAMSVSGLFAAKQLCPSLAPVLPGVPIPGYGVLIPLIAWVSLAIILISHELSHGLMLDYYREKIRSVGLLLAGIFPIGAFVEQDNKTFDRLEDKKALMVLSAGPSMNLFSILVGAGLIALLSFSLVPLGPYFGQEFGKMYYGVKVNAVYEKVAFCGIEKPAPAFGKLLAGDKVLAVNGADVNSIFGVNAEFVKADGDLNFNVLRDGNMVFVAMEAVSFEDLNIKKIGVDFAAIPTGYEPPIWVTVFSALAGSINSILFFLVILGFAAGTFNFLPSAPLDGGYMAKIMLLPYFGFMKFETKAETKKFIGRLCAWLFVIAIVLNLIPYLTMAI